MLRRSALFLTGLLLPAMLLILLASAAVSAQTPSPGGLYLPLVMVYNPPAAPTPTPGPTPGDGTVLRLTAAADAYVFEAGPTVNRGAAEYVMTGYDQDEATMEGRLRALIRFNLPEGVVSRVKLATLRIYYGGYSDVTGATRAVTASNALEPWDESTVTWKNRPGLGEPYGSVSIKANDEWGYREIDLTALAREWFDGITPNRGIYLTSPESSGSDYSYRLFLSRESAKPPELVIQFQ